MKNWHLSVIFGLAIIGLVYWLGRQTSTAPLDQKTTLTKPEQQEGGLMDVSQSTTAETKEESVEPEGVPIAGNIKLETSKGVVTLELFPEKAPDTVQNFLEKAQSGFYEGLIFHRVEDWVVQGGDPLGNGTGGGSMPTELNDVPFGRGSLGVARSGDIQVSNDAQFFVCTKDCDWLTGQYTNFGKVLEGMEVVDQLEVGDKILNIQIIE